MYLQANFKYDFNQEQSQWQVLFNATLCLSIHMLVMANSKCFQFDKLHPYKFSLKFLL